MQTVWQKAVKIDQACMLPCNLYTKDKMFALQYVAAAENGSKIPYRTPQEEDRGSVFIQENKRQTKYHR